MDEVIKAILKRKELAKKLVAEHQNESFQKYNQGYLDGLDFILELLEEEDIL